MLRKVCIDITNAVTRARITNGRAGFPAGNSIDATPTRQWQVVVSESTDEEGLAPVQSVHVAKRDDPADHGNHPECDVGEHGLVLGHARFLQHPGAVVHDGVDAGELLGHGDADAYQDDAYKPPV